MQKIPALQLMSAIAQVERVNAIMAERKKNEA
jgi:hypothetical protein